jgi:hypothetical protein
MKDDVAYWSSPVETGTRRSDMRYSSMVRRDDSSSDEESAVSAGLW